MKSISHVIFPQLLYNTISVSHFLTKKLRTLKNSLEHSHFSSFTDWATHKVRRGVETGGVVAVGRMKCLGHHGWWLCCIWSIVFEVIVHIYIDIMLPLNVRWLLADNQDRSSSSALTTAIVPLVIFQLHRSLLCTITGMSEVKVRTICSTGCLP